MKNLDTKEMHAYYMARNINLNEAGEFFGLTGPGLRKRFIKEGLPTKSRNQTREKNIDCKTLQNLYLEQNNSIDELAVYFSCSRGAVWNKLCEMGINKSSAEAKAIRQENYMLWTDELINDVKRLLEETHSIVDTAQILKVSENTLQEKNQTWGIQVGFWSDENIAMARDLLNTHRDYSFVSKELGISEFSLISKNLRDWKIDLSDNSNIFGIPTVGLDGVKYDSKLEASVANFLAENNINYENQVKVCDERKWTCDFKIGELWIEVDGLESWRINTKTVPYDNGNEKILYYKEKGFNFIILKKSGWKKQLNHLLGLGV